MPENELIGFDIEGLAELLEGLKRMQPEIQDAAGDELAPYLKNVVQAQPSYRYVSRRSAFGVTFFSDKQRRWFFRALNLGEIEVPYKRSQRFRRGWKIIGSGIGSIVVNDTPYGGYLMGDQTQSRHMKKIGWKKLGDLIDEKKGEIVRKLEAGAKKGMKKAGFDV
jgi:UDP-N-acetylglucosamine enolpyruvyl transferase